MQAALSEQLRRIRFLEGLPQDGALCAIVPYPVASPLAAGAKTAVPDCFGIKVEVAALGSQQLCDASRPLRNDVNTCALWSVQHQPPLSSHAKLQNGETFRSYGQTQICPKRCAASEAASLDAELAAARHQAQHAQQVLQGRQAGVQAARTALSEKCSSLARRVRMLRRQPEANSQLVVHAEMRRLPRKLHVALQQET